MQSLKKIHIVCVRFFLYYILHFLVLHKPFSLFHHTIFEFPSLKNDSPGMSYVRSSVRFMFMNPLFSNIENGLISFAIKTPIYLVISPCFVNDLGYLFLRPRACGKRSCPVDMCLFFSQLSAAAFVFDIVIPCLRRI